MTADLVAPRLALYALLHDAAECIGGDCPSPLKTPDISHREHKITKRIYAAAGLRKISSEDYFQIKEADRLALRGELHVCGTVALRKEYKRAPSVERLTRKYMRKYSPMDCINPKGKAVRDFLARYEGLKGTQK